MKHQLFLVTGVVVIEFGNALISAFLRALCVSDGRDIQNLCSGVAPHMTVQDKMRAEKVLEELNAELEPIMQEEWELATGMDPVSLRNRCNGAARGLAI